MLTDEALRMTSILGLCEPGKKLSGWSAVQFGGQGGSAKGMSEGVGPGGSRPVLVFPLRPGATWAVGEATAHVRGVEPVAVPAGRYEAVRVDEVTAAPGGAVTVTCWYASGVGLVKQVRKVGDQEPVVAVLESFTPGKK